MESGHARGSRIGTVPLSPYPLPIPLPRRSVFAKAGSSWGEGAMLLVKQNVLFSLAPGGTSGERVRGEGHPTPTARNLGFGASLGFGAWFLGFPKEGG